MQPSTHPGAPKSFTYFGSSGKTIPKPTRSTNTIRKMTRIERFRMNSVDVIHEYVERHRPARHNFTRRAFAEHEHGVADAQFAMRPVSSARSDARFHGVEDANQEVRKTTVRHPHVWRDGREPFANIGEFSSGHCLPPFPVAHAGVP